MKEKAIFKAAVPAVYAAGLVLATGFFAGCAQNAALVRVAVPDSTTLRAAMLASSARPSVVRLVKTAQGGYRLTLNGKPYVIKGAGGSGPLSLLRQCGGNSSRTWGSDNLGPILADAQANGMTITAGVWLGHKDNGFDYHDAAAVAAQKEMARKTILQYKNSPSLLLWAFGNEMEQGQQDDPAVWQAIEDIAKMSHQLDPNHPTMTVVAELGGDKVAQINKYCPDIDIVGINSYAGASSIGQRYRDGGGTKPYIVTEYGPPGVWEMQKNAWGAAPEPTSTEKSDWYRKAYEKGIAAEPLCLGSYAFTWGNKQEATATWFGLLLPDGSRTDTVDTLTKLWTGKPPAQPAPEITTLKLDGPDKVGPGATVHAALTASDPAGTPLMVEWVLQSDPASYHTGGATEDSPAAFPDAVTASSTTGATLKMPAGGGAYRLFAYVRDIHGGAAVGNIPLFVTGDAPLAPASAPKATLPLVVVGDGAQGEAPYIPSGYMGFTGAIHMDAASTDHPHSGATCLKVDFAATQNWGGVVWQSPANDWGDKPGGFNLSGAKKLSFWARGAAGGESVTFQYGLLGKDKKYPDTAQGKKKVTLTRDWVSYTLDLTGQDLSDIKTGFCWVAATTDHPVTFYIDDVRYE